MKWLITIASGEELDRAIRVLAEAGARPSGEPVPFDNGEKAIPVEGPGDLPQRLRNVAGVVKVSPSSDMSYY